MTDSRYQITMQTPLGALSGTMALMPNGEKLNGAVFFNGQRYQFSGVKLSASPARPQQK